MAGNGHYSGEFERLVDLVEEIDVRTKTNGALLDSMTGHLQAIASNTGAVAKHYEAVQTDNRALTKLLVRLLLVIIGAVAVYLTSDNLKNSGLNVRVPWLGVEITQHDAKG